jgi:hypothetical protein
MTNETKKLYIVVNIGCIECGVSSNIVGIFDDKELADTIADKLCSTMGWRDNGQNDYEVFEMPEVNTITEEYISGLED